MPDLNQQVCEKLGIPPLAEVCRCGHDAVWHNISSPGCSECSHRRSTEPCRGFEFAMAAYPELATEAGFFILWAALKRNGWSTCAVDDGPDCWAKLSRAGGVEVRSGYYDTAPRALLMAAAAALGVPDA